MNRKYFSIILIGFVLLFSSAIFSQELIEKQLEITYVEGNIFIRNIGDLEYKKGIINQYLTYEKEFKIEDGNSCRLGLNDKEIPIQGPLKLRAKDILDAENRIENVSFNNPLINRVSNLFIHTNEEIETNRSLRINSQNEDSLLKDVINIKKKSYFEKAFILSSDYIKKEKNRYLITVQKPELSRFYYQIMEISFQTLNYNIAKAAFKEIMEETKNKSDDETNVNIKKRVKQDAYFLMSMILFMEGDYDNAIIYLKDIITEFTNESYYKERISYLTYYMLGISYYQKNELDNAKVYLETSSRLCRIAINDNIEKLKANLLAKRTTSVEVRINHSNIMANESSLILGYINKIQLGNN